VVDFVDVLLFDVLLLVELLLVELLWANARGADAAPMTPAPDAVLLDVQLPDLDGFSVATALTANGGPVVVLVSSREAEDYGRRIAACGARGFIAKRRLTAAAFAALVA